MSSGATQSQSLFSSATSFCRKIRHSVSSNKKSHQSQTIWDPQMAYYQGHPPAPAMGYGTYYSYYPPQPPQPPHPYPSYPSYQTAYQSQPRVSGAPDIPPSGYPSAANYSSTRPRQPPSAQPQQFNAQEYQPTYNLTRNLRSQSQTRPPPDGHTFYTHPQNPYPDNRNRSASSIGDVHRTDAPPVMTPGHAPNIEPHDYFQQRNRSSSAINTDMWRSSSQRTNGGPLGHPGGTPWQPNAPLEVESDDTPELQCYTIVPELASRVTSYPSIDWMVWQRHSYARMWISPTKNTVVNSRTIAIEPTVTKLTIGTRQRRNEFSIVLARWGDIPIMSYMETPAPLTIRDILLGIWDYFQTPILPEDWATFDADYISNIHRAYDRRRASNRLGGSSMPASAMEGARRSDALFGLWRYAGLQVDPDFENTRKLYLTLTQGDATHWPTAK